MEPAGNIPEVESPTEQYVHRKPVRKTSPWKLEYQKRYQRERRGGDYLTPAELERCRLQPALIRDIRGPKWIACPLPLCGRLARNLSHHLRFEHFAELEPEVTKIISGSVQLLTPTKSICLAFRMRFRLAKHFPLMCKEFSKEAAERMTIANRTPKTPRDILRKRIKSANEARIEWPVTQAQSEARGRNLRMHRQEPKRKFLKKALEPMIAQMRLDGVTSHVIAERCGISEHTVLWHLRKLGFPSRAFARHLGVPVGGRHLALLLDDWIAVRYSAELPPASQSLNAHQQFTVTEAAESLGVSVAWIHHHANPRYQSSRTLTTYRLGCVRGRRLYLGNAQIQLLLQERDRIRASKLRQRALFEIADALKRTPAQLRSALKARFIPKQLGDRIVGLWGALKVRWRSKASGGRKGGAPRKLLPSEQSFLRERYSPLRIDLGALAKTLKLANRRKRELPSGTEEWICHEAKRGRMRTLLFWPEFFSWAARDREWEIGVGDWRPGDLAKAFMAFQFAVKERTVKEYLLS